MFVALLLAVTGLGFAVAQATGPLGQRAHSATLAKAAVQPALRPAPQGVLPATSLEPRPAFLTRGDTGPKVRELEARLRQLGWFWGRVDGRYNGKTAKAVAAFQEHRGMPVTGEVNRPTQKRLKKATRKPSRAELFNGYSDGTWTTARLDPRCTTGRALCVDKKSRTVRWVVDGEVRKTMAVRFGSAYTPTREGLFRVQSKSRYHVSTLYHTPMPFAMFFSGGQAVHYSPDFAAVGYAGASHGCVNVRDYNGIRWLFDQVAIGDKVVVYWS